MGRPREASRPARCCLYAAVAEISRDRCPAGGVSCFTETALPGLHLSLLEGGDVRTVVLQSDPRDAAPRSLHRPAVAALPRRRRGVAPGGFLAVADADSPADSSPGAADARDLPARRRPRPEAGQ